MPKQLLSLLSLPVSHLLLTSSHCICLPQQGIDRGPKLNWHNWTITTNVFFCEGHSFHIISFYSFRFVISLSFIHYISSHFILMLPSIDIDPCSMPNDRSRRDSSLEVRPDMTAAQEFGVWLCPVLYSCQNGNSWVTQTHVSTIKCQINTWWILAA